MTCETIKLDEHSWLIQEGVGESGVYMYLMEGNERAVLVDTGYGTIPLAQICRTLTDKPISVILTHGHIDHIGGSGQFDEVYLHVQDTEVYRFHGTQELRRRFADVVLPPAKENTLPIKEKDSFRLGGRTLEIIEAPGHSLGSVCILDRERKWLFTGDTCCKAHVLLHMEYCATPQVYLGSIRKLLGREQEYDLIWPAHHIRPVGKEVLYQFEIAAAGLVDGRLQGEDYAVGGENAKLLMYGDIGIIYTKDIVK